MEISENRGRKALSLQAGCGEGEAIEGEREGIHYATTITVQIPC